MHEAADGLAGLALIANDPRIALAFVDIGLPGMSGYDGYIVKPANLEALRAEIEKA